jgi:type I restriction enzyme S subunit
MYIYSKDSQVLDKYLFWYTNREEFWPRSSSAQPFISLGDIRSLKIPIPDLATQQRIIGAMDGLDALIADISSGLPAEIHARRQQYEHYRSKLLTFKKLEVA